jgi:large subunit ribosomal protein L7/L12
LCSALYMPGPGVGAAAGGAVAAPAAAKAAAPAAAPKEEKTHFDIKLKAFDQKNKIKVIKEVRAVTNLGLKEAKELVESVPATILQKVKKEDAAKIMEKLKAETGAELELV